MNLAMGGPVLSPTALSAWNVIETSAGLSRKFAVIWGESWLSWKLACLLSSAIHTFMRGVTSMPPPLLCTPFAEKLSASFSADVSGLPSCKSRPGHPAREFWLLQAAFTSARHSLKTDQASAAARAPALCKQAFSVARNHICRSRLRRTSPRHMATAWRNGPLRQARPSRLTRQRFAARICSPIASTNASRRRFLTSSTAQLQAASAPDSDSRRSDRSTRRRTAHQRRAASRRTVGTIIPQSLSARCSGMVRMLALATAPFGPTSTAQ
mmetsp:Transcript_99403/g.176290  ORF Transcript_99403/g.176290 Transcript_99403/m.176290 type:complete len:268 (+) Transcript_99403:1105-1908(+)